MYDKKIYQQVSGWMDAHKEEMIRDIQRLVRIPSISAPDTAADMAAPNAVADIAVPNAAADISAPNAAAGTSAPFGAACREAMDLMLQIGREHGFHTENHEYYVGSIGEENKDWENLIGFWNHLDVVPVGGDWDYPPFEAVRKGDLVIGRGSQDNKGPAVAMLYVMQCVRELALPVGHQLCLFVGCDEERGMEDMEYYTSRYPLPALSVISDCGFPVCYGEKGIIEGKTVSMGRMSENILDFSGGNAGNIIPDRAVLLLKEGAVSEEQLSGLPEDVSVTRGEGRICLTASGVAGHSAFPEGSSNAILNLAAAVLESGMLQGTDRDIVEAVCRAVTGYYGEAFGIDYEDQISGRLTCAGTVLRLTDGHAELTFNIRYSITADGGKITDRLAGYWKEKGFVWETQRDSAPSYFDPSHPVVGRLTDIYNEITGSSREAYTMGGGTYARKLPRAFGFGIGNMPEKEKEESRLIRPGHGNAHGPDEVLDCERLAEAAKVYVMALLSIRDMKLTESVQEGNERK